MLKTQNHAHGMKALHAHIDIGGVYTQKTFGRTSTVILTLANFEKKILLPI